MSRRPLVALALVVLCLAPAAPSSAVRRPHPRTGAGPVPVVLIVMENKRFGAIVGNPRAAYLNGTLIPAGTLFTRSHAITQPSLPNYLALTAGSTLGCTTNTCSPGFGADNVFAQLHRAGISWTSWASSMLERCDRSTVWPYAARHNPAVYYANLSPQPCRSHVVPYPHPLPDRLPSFVFVAPNLCQDMHDCSIARGDRWLSRQVPRFLARGAIVIVTFDEAEGNSTRIATIVAGPGIAADMRDERRLTHYGVLAGIERHFGLGRLRHASTARPLPI